MITIHKFPLDTTDEQIVSMQEPAKILKAGLDPTGRPVLWAIVDTEKEWVHAQIVILGTGLEWNTTAAAEFSALQHLGSFNSGHFLWHVFRHEELVRFELGYTQHFIMIGVNIRTHTSIGIHVRSQHL
ncbi:hypothetical protein LCGC14_2533820 [marine sediment metagenome]|uniref:DUF7352 domain-containing protein n=1 Tax=marine sediment metagenome TaxID=412755 RepID=A0A0F9BFM0_9ZZZZ